MDVNYRFGSELPRADGQTGPGPQDVNPYVVPVNPNDPNKPNINQKPDAGSYPDGYGDFDFGELRPPAPDSDRDITGPDPNRDRKEMEEIKPISQEHAKAALVQLASANFCYGKKPANEVVVESMKPSAAYHYCVESFCEIRSTAQAEVPFTGGGMSVDTSANGQPPTPWEVQVFAKEKFKDEKKVCEVPHTASVQNCRVCQGKGQENCTACQTRGQIPCTQCNGQQGSECQACQGHGSKVCSACAGKGVKTCANCKGAKMVKSYIQLTVEWKNHVSHFVQQTQSSLPEQLVQSAPGQVVFKEENPWVYPISQCPEPAINKASLDLLTKHKEQFKNERLLLQRQTVKIVPITEVHCQWEGKSFVEYVYGTDNQAYCPDYPQKWLCGYCNIL